jgi:hypothetical protein
MRKLIYSMTVSLDGFIAGPDGDFSWSAPDEELHRFHNQVDALEKRAASAGLTRQLDLEARADYCTR